MNRPPFDLRASIRRVRRAGESRSALVRRTFATSVDELWATCTQPDRMARWLGEVRGDPASGTVDLAIGGGEFVARCEILRCEPPQLLELVWSEPDQDDSVVRATVSAVDGGAELAIEHYALTRPEGIAFGAGWEEFMADLGDALVGRARSHDCEALEAQMSAIWTDLPAEIDDRWGSFDADGFTLVRTFDAEPSRVWAAVATAEGLGSWFGQVTGDLAPAGAWTVAFDDGEAHGEVESCEPGRRFTTTFTQSGSPALVHRAEVTVAQAPVGTSLRVRHAYAEGGSAALRRGLAAGWYAHFEGLARVLAGSPADDAAWYADFRVARLVHR